MYILFVLGLIANAKERNRLVEYNYIGFTLSRDIRDHVKNEMEVISESCKKKEKNPFPWVICRKNMWVLWEYGAASSNRLHVGRLLMFFFFY